MKTGHHCRHGNDIQLRDLLQRDIERWKSPIEPESVHCWDAFAVGFTTFTRGCFSISDLKVQIELILSSQEELAENSTTEKSLLLRQPVSMFDCEQNIHLICYMLGVTPLLPKPSTMWDRSNWVTLADALSGSKVFPSGMTIEQLDFAVHCLSAI